MQKKQRVEKKNKINATSRTTRCKQQQKQTRPPVYAAETYAIAGRCIQQRLFQGFCTLSPSLCAQFRSYATDNNSRGERFQFIFPFSTLPLIRFITDTLHAPPHYTTRILRSEILDLDQSRVTTCVLNISLSRLDSFSAMWRNLSNR